MQVILETIAGVRRVQEACEELSICEQRFETIRSSAIQAGIAALEAKPVGRPAKVVTPAELEVARLQERIAELEVQLQAALVKADLAGVLPRLGLESGKRSPRSGPAKESKRSRSRPGNISKR